MNTRMRVTAIPTLMAASLLGKFGAFSAVAAQTESFEDLGLEKISLVMTPDTITGMPIELAAGNYLVELSGEPMEGETDLSVMLFRFPDGMTLDTMPALDPSSPMLPDFIYEGTFAGGRDVILDTGETSSQCVVTLTAGDWMLADGQLVRPLQAFTVTGEVPADAPTPTSTVDMMMGEMYFHITGGELVAGRNVLSLTAMGGQPHFVVMLGLPPGMTDDQFEMMFAAAEGPEEESSPTAEDGGGDEGGGIAAVLVTSIQSLGTTSWMNVELASGTYGLACFFPDQHVGMPHAMLGMHTVVEVP
ncbi:MAG: hypothetical protein KC435_10195 [Thermomicrobiales bacterium]|nr:hypothetical protein [Thermomicrobiales bacterium]